MHRNPHIMPLRVSELAFCLLVYRKLQNVSLGLIGILRPIFGDLYSGGALFGGHLVAVLAYKDLKSIITSSKYKYHQNIIGKKDLSSSQNKPYFASPI